MNKENKELMNKLWRDEQRVKYPSVPEKYLTGFPHKDNSANGLTKCIIFYVNSMGGFAERISTTGRIIDNTKTVTDVVGFRKTIGSKKYIKGTGVNGSADISATIRGRSVKIEVKYGKDRQSEAQKEYEKRTIQSGGIYYIARTFDDFIEWMKEIS